MRAAASNIRAGEDFGREAAAVGNAACVRKWTARGLNAWPLTHKGAQR
jgi:hypothetical protein